MTKEFPFIILETIKTKIVSWVAMNRDHKEKLLTTDSADENVKRIIELSSDKFFKEGFSKITMDELAGDLQMSKKTIYKYFDSKKSLVEALLKTITGNAARELTAIVESQENAVHKIMGILEFFGSISNIISERMILDLQKKLPWLWKQIDEFRAKMMYKNLSKLIDQGKEEGLVEDYPTDIAITIIIAGVRSVINPDFIINNNYSIKTAFKHCFEFLFNGLLTEKGKEIFNNYKKEAE